MLQEHSYFSRPLIYFGVNQNAEEEEDVGEEEWCFENLWRTDLHANMSVQWQQRTGLFIHWNDVSE